MNKEGNKDNIIEDFDITQTVLKSDVVVSGRINSQAHTETPNVLYQFYKQRKR